MSRLHFPVLIIASTSIKLTSRLYFPMFISRCSHSGQIFEGWFKRNLKKYSSLAFLLVLVSRE